MNRLGASAIALLLIVAACGDDDATPTTTTPRPPTATTVPPSTTTDPTTATSPTTTNGDTTTTAPAPTTAPTTSSAPDDPRFVGPDEMGVAFIGGAGCFPGSFDPIPGEEIAVAPGAKGAGIPGDPTSLAVGACSAVPGQTVRLAPGIYRTSVVLGAFEGPITIAGGDGVVLDGDGIRTTGIGLVESSGFVITGIEFRGYADAGLYTLLGSDVEITGNRFVDNGRASTLADNFGEGFGLDVVGTENVVIQGNVAERNGPSEERMADAILGTGINTFEMVDGVIRDNVSRDNHGGGILVEEGIGVVVEGNVVGGNRLDAAGDWWDGAIWVDGGRDVVIRGNTITGNAGPGLQLSDEEDAYPARSVGYVVEGNVITDNLYGIYVWGWGTCPDPPDDAVVFGGNEVSGNTVADRWCED